MIKKTHGEDSSKYFLVRVRGKEFIFDKEHFIDFCKKSTKRDWTFSFGDKNTNVALRPSKSIRVEELLEIFKLEDIQNLLQYKKVKFGTQWILDMPFFSERVYFKYGKEIKWEDEYSESGTLDKKTSGKVI